MKSKGSRGEIRTCRGKINWVELDLGKDAVDLDHMISPEERLRGAMAIQ